MIAGALAGARGLLGSFRVATVGGSAAGKNSLSGLMNKESIEDKVVRKVYEEGESDLGLLRCGEAEQIGLVESGGAPLSGWTTHVKKGQGAGEATLGKSQAVSCR